MHVIKKMFNGITLGSMLLLLVFPGGSEVIKNHINLEDIQKVEGKLKLELLQEWSSEEEMNEHKILYEPMDVAFNDNDDIFILEANKIKVFNKSGKHLRTFGNAGVGPGEFLRPDRLEIDEENNIVVMDKGNLRVQILNQQGEYLGGFKLGDNRPGPIAITNNNVILINRSPDLKLSSLWFLYNHQGQLAGERGHRISGASWFEIYYRNSYFISSDAVGNLYFAHEYQPLIQIFSPGGELLKELSYEVPFEVPEVKSNRYKGRESVEYENVCNGIDIDSKGKIFLLTLSRLKNNEEKLVGITTGTISRSRPTEVKVGKAKYDINSIGEDLYQILVFDNSGKIIASKKLNILADNIRIHKDRLFLIDTNINMKIYEYQFSIQ
ncbi:MAG: 6-bladed beta-propeller [Methanosarcinaceae archaeon]|nr:6-bladed beta-propeller [Methanosarcinaceae archaeon]